MAAALLAACSLPDPEIRPYTHIVGGEQQVSAFDAAYDAGKAHLRADRVGLALASFQRALAIDPNSVAALNAIGSCYDDLHFPDLATPFYLKALQIEPRSADTLNNMGVSAMLAGKADQARELFARAAALDADNRTIHTNLKVVNAPVVQTVLPIDAPDPDVPKEIRPTIQRQGVSAFLLTIPDGVRPDVLVAELPPLFKDRR
jgi:Tfp pilus assembly protein PilF